MPVLKEIVCLTVSITTGLLLLCLANKGNADGASLVSLLIVGALIAVTYLLVRKALNR
ncbi:hypothetical protein [Alteromonas halophila]|uniref:Uncharacterized protein n=1 Tax=Alteromonas halophila TaxID=516698 RepID=A0A918MX99_9ALTE|nr:hypothetical protein [Alteromonas halophila]GGW83304.1 hypothetical protein GCM10007391_15900 [Alteromonas halophila]